jgi:long-chain acyl-CoA synthetase
LTEASRAAFIEFHTQKNFLDTIGQASPNVTITIRDEAGTVLESGCEGEICVDGGMVMQSYWEDPNLTVESFWGRTFRTGDRGAMDANGFIRLIGREKEMINVGGRKVIPIEIEEKIKNIKGIADCACIGVPDTISGEAIKAFIVAEDAPIAEEDILHILRPQMETYKIPQSFEWIDRIPYMFSGKVQRSALEDLSSD